MRLAITAGGTGGHIVPALVVAEAVARRQPGTVLRFFGPEDRGERASVEAAGVEFMATPAAAVRGKSPFALARASATLSRGILASRSALKRFDPDCVFSTGGYGSFPACVAARQLGLPLVVFLPDVTPGWAVRAESRLATRLATTTDAALEHLPASKSTVTGYPVRPEFTEVDRESARSVLGIPHHERVLLVAGASQGALVINEAIYGAIDSLARMAIVHHITGEVGYPAAMAAKRSLPTGLAARYRPAPYREDMPVLMHAADLAVMRAGASTLGELPAARLPAILVPGTFAGGHQYANARWLADHGAGIVVDEAALDLLPSRIQAVIADSCMLEGMAARSAALHIPGAAARITDIIEEVAC